MAVVGSVSREGRRGLRRRRRRRRHDGPLPAVGLFRNPLPSHLILAFSVQGSAVHESQRRARERDGPLYGTTVVHALCQTRRARRKVQRPACIRTDSFTVCSLS